MTHVLGLTLICGSWLYVMATVLYARATYRKLVQANPGYFSDTQNKVTRALNWERSFGIIKFVGDEWVERGYDEQLGKRIKTTKLLYLGTPLAFILFVVGIFLR